MQRSRGVPARCPGQVPRTGAGFKGLVAKPSEKWHFALHPTFSATGLIHRGRPVPGQGPGSDSSGSAARIEPLRETRQCTIFIFPGSTPVCCRPGLRKEYFCSIPGSVPGTWCPRGPRKICPWTAGRPSGIWLTACALGSSSPHPVSCPFLPPEGSMTSIPVLSIPSGASFGTWKIPALRDREDNIGGNRPR